MFELLSTVLLCLLLEAVFMYWLDWCLFYWVTYGCCLLIMFAKHFWLTTFRELFCTRSHYKTMFVSIMYKTAVWAFLHHNDNNNNSLKVFFWLGWGLHHLTRTKTVWVTLWVFVLSASWWPLVSECMTRKQALVHLTCWQAL